MKNGLFATTALISVLSISLATASPLQTSSEAYGLDANQTFLCNYGFIVNTRVFWQDSSETAAGTTWIHAAVPIYGKGKTINEIVVAEAPGPSTNSGIRVAIYWGKKKPDHELVSGTANAPKKCERIRVSVPPTLLKKGKKYWVVEAAVAPPLENPLSSSGQLNSMTWAYDQKRTQGAMWQSGYSCYGSYVCCRGFNCHKVRKQPWQNMSGVVPYVRVR